MEFASRHHNLGMTAAGATSPARATSSHGSTSPLAVASVTSSASVDTARSTSGSGHGSAPAIKRRSPIACRRCRRMRSKCVHEKGKPPCKSCFEAGIPIEECIFPIRGQPDLDREYRHPRTRSDNSNKDSTGLCGRSKRTATNALSSNTRNLANEWESLPHIEDMIDGVNLFTRQCFQLGFIPKEQYPERLRKALRSNSLFLLMSILSISARLSPALKLRHGNSAKAAEYYMERASVIANEEVYKEPTLERCQAFYLLSIAQQDGGERNKSFINMGIAMRMAILMQLHREETYHIPNPTPELVKRAESARRTLWMLYSQDNLHSGPLSPVSLSASDITTLLPCNEEDFALGREPRSRAALDGTPPAIDNPALIRDPGRSLFGTLMQVHHWWGFVSRRAVRYIKSSRPWDPASEFSQTARKLREWEQDLPHEHVWSNFLLKGYNAERQELAYLCVTMMTRLSNIVLRRPYLIDIIDPDTRDPTKKAFFKSMSDEIFANVRYLYEQIDAQFTNRSPDESTGSQIAAFCVYSCGLFSSYLCKYPNICQDKVLVRDAPMMLQRIIGVLKECREVWPLASRWVDALEKLSLDPQSATTSHEGGMDDGKIPLIPRTIRQLPPLFPPKSSRQHGPPHPPPLTLPEPNILPRLGTQPELPPASSIESPRKHHSSSTTPGHAQPITVMHHHLPSPPQHHLHHPQSPSQYPTPPATLPPPISTSSSAASYPTTLHAQSPSHPMQAAHQMYVPPHPTPPLRMLPDAFDPAHAPPLHIPGPYESQLVPGTDGFEDELQFYIDGPPATWLQLSP